MRVVCYAHSLVSDWNHGNAHFLRGVLSELLARGHDAVAWEPARGWSRENLRAAHPEAERAFAAAFPHLVSHGYGTEAEALAALDGADLVLVHEWTDPSLVAAVGRARARGGRFALLFHDTHHRAVSDPEAMAAYDLSGYDGVLAFGEALREVYARQGWGARAWTWHEAADTRVFRPLEAEPEGDAVWIGNWGDEERSGELEAFLFGPAERAGVRLAVHGVRYPEAALARLARAGAEYRGWLPNARVPLAFARHRFTVHVPRRFYVERLPGIPTIRPFEALACGIPLLSAPWRDEEGLFRVGEDFLMVHGPEEAEAAMRRLVSDAGEREALRRSGLETIHARHTCAHRVDELLGILASLRSEPPAARAAE